MAIQLSRPLPQPDLDTEPYWEAARQHKLVVQHCPKQGIYQHPPKPRLKGCGFDFEWKEVSGRGRVYSFTIIYLNGPTASAKNKEEVR